MMKVWITLLLPVVLVLASRCVSDSLSPLSLTSGSIRVDDRSRGYLLHLPANPADTLQALVIVLHGGGGSAAQAERDYGWTVKSDAEQFVVVYPDGVPSDGPLKLHTWNAGLCCDYASENNIDDVKFISTLIDHLSAKYPINKRRVYVTGLSNGAMMAYRLACEIPEKIAAIAPVSGPLMTTQPCNASRAMPIFHIHSELDTKVPYQGGEGILGYSFSSVDSTLRVFAGLNHCQSLSPTVTSMDQYTVYQLNGCDQPIQSYITKDGGHSWPGGLKPRAKADNPSQAFRATDVIWDFFKQHQLP